jgi:hypothetical protein
MKRIVLSRRAISIIWLNFGVLAFLNREVILWSARQGYFGRGNNLGAFLAKRAQQWLSYTVLSWER